MTQKERAAMQQALEALESYSKSDYIKKQHPKRRANGEKAITALRKALAEQEKPLYRKVLREMLDAHEQAEQEPVAYLRMGSDQRFVVTKAAEELVADTFHQLYAAPVRTKDLTDEEIMKAWNESDDMTLPEFARAVIAADREKNK